MLRRALLCRAPLPHYRFVHLRGVMTDEEMRQNLDEIYYKFLRGEIPVPGKDLCDMSGVQGRTPDQYTIYNVMLPRLYFPPLQGNLLEQRCLVRPGAWAGAVVRAAGGKVANSSGCCGQQGRKSSRGVSRGVACSTAAAFVRRSIASTPPVPACLPVLGQGQDTARQCRRAVA